MIASLAYDDLTKGDLLSIKLDSLQQFTYIKKAHNAPIISLKGLWKYDWWILVSCCT